MRDNNNKMMHTLLSPFTENLEYLLESLAPILEDQIRTDEKQ